MTCLDALLLDANNGISEDAVTGRASLCLLLIFDPTIKSYYKMWAGADRNENASWMWQK